MVWKAIAVADRIYEENQLQGSLLSPFSFPVSIMIDFISIIIILYSLVFIILILFLFTTAPEMCHLRIKKNYLENVTSLSLQLLLKSLVTMGLAALALPPPWYSPTHIQVQSGIIQSVRLHKEYKGMRNKHGCPAWWGVSLN